MLEIRNAEECCGCHACAAVCMRNCISMKTDEEGFLYPDIDYKNCINCGKCEKHNHKW